MDRSRIKRGVTITAAILAAVAVIGGAWIWFAPCWLGGCAPLDDLAEYQAEGSTLLDVDGEVIGVLATVNRRIISLDSLPDHVSEAFLAVEDKRFYDHSGLDLWRIAGAFVSNIRAGGVAEGGSTITMQLARNLFPEWLPYTERSVRRKLMEMRVARQIEREFGKRKILELYLNHIYLGNGAYGVETASHAYFGKSASELTLAQAAVVGGLAQAPSRLDPTANPEAALRRRNLVLREMAQAGYITPAEAADAREEELVLSEEETDPQDPKNSYFVERVRQEMDEMIGQRFYTAGLEIHTTMDLDIQHAAQEELAQQLDAIETGRFGRFPHPTYPEARDVEGKGETPYLQGAAVVIDVSSGAVRALVGGRDFEDSKFDRAVQAQRQAGSAFKPFVYLAALERYRTPAHQVEDAPVRMVLSGGQVWEPKNYTGRYEGTMTLRDALARSKNSVTVRLAQSVGIGRVIETARDLGISTNIPHVPAAALGAADVRPIELVQAYAALANGGDRVRPHFIHRVVNRYGAVVWQAPAERVPVVDRSTAFVMTSMLQDVVDRGTGNAVRAVGFRAPAAGKTGTTNDATDVWFVGYTPELAAGIWIGFDEPRTIVRGASGGTLAAPAWGRMMRRIYADRPTPEGWSRPPDVRAAEVERGTGVAVSELCPARGPTYTEYFIRTSPPRQYCPPEDAYAYNEPWDTLWVDEEWTLDPSDPDNLSDDDGEVAPGIDWPELEALRRRIRIGERGERPEADTSATRPPAGEEPASDRDPQQDRPEPRQPAPPREGGNEGVPPAPATEDGPELLGTPIDR